MFVNCSQARKETKLSYIGGTNISSKIKKNLKVNMLTYIVYLAPSDHSGHNVCTSSTVECRLGCLATSGRNMMDINSGKHIINNARVRKTQLFFDHNEYYMEWLVAEIKSKQLKAIKDNNLFSVRLNGTSDINWQEIMLNGKNIFEIFPDVQFYDYTKNAKKFINIAKNYDLTFSYTGKNWSTCQRLLSIGYNVAMIFKDSIPNDYKGYTVLNGDLTDNRIGDLKGCIVGLKWKRIANKEINEQIKNSVFVIQ
jgi:hypothetical protein